MIVTASPDNYEHTVNNNIIKVKIDDKDIDAYIENVKFYDEDVAVIHCAIKGKLNKHKLFLQLKHFLNFYYVLKFLGVKKVYCTAESENITEVKHRLLFGFKPIFTGEFYNDYHKSIGLQTLFEMEIK